MGLFDWLRKKKTHEDTVVKESWKPILLWSYKIGGGKVLYISISHDGSYIAGGTYSGEYREGIDNKVYLFNREGKLLWNYTVGWVNSVSITPDSSYIAAGSGPSVYLFNKKGKLLWSYETGDDVRSVAITPDGSYIAAGSWYGYVYLFAATPQAIISYLKLKIEEAESLGLTVETKAFELFEEGEYEKATEEAQKTIDGISEFYRLKEEISRAEQICILPHEIVNSIKEVEGLLNNGEYGEAIERAEESMAEIEKALRESSPNLSIRMHDTEFRLNTWVKTGMYIKNDGNAIARDVEIAFSEDVVVRNLEKISIVKPGEKKSVEFSLMPKVEGSVPLEVTITYKDHRNEEKSAKQTLWIDVGLVPAQPTPLTPEFAKPTTPKTFPPELAEDYEEVEYIGKGGFARVFKAKRKDGKVVAVKIPISLDEATGKSFIREIENWTKLNHGNIVRVYDYNILPIPYFEMELCDCSLADIKKPIEPEKAAWLIFNIAEGLKYAHSKGIVHRDLKPQNIMLKDGIPKISDWGLSKVMTESTSTSVTAFTPYYAAPEQIAGGDKDERTDVWQLGIIFYELVTGELPFRGDNVVEVGMAIATKQLIPPSGINPEAKDVEPIIMKCLEKDKAKSLSVS